MEEKEFLAFIEGEASAEFTGADLKSHLDRAVAAGIGAYKTNHPEKDIPADIAEATAAKDAEIGTLKIDNEVIRQCHKRDIPEDFITDLGITFATVEEIDPKLEKIAGRLESTKERNLNEILAAGFKPGHGVAQGERENVQTMSLRRAKILEEAGELDDTIIGNI